MNIRSGKQLLTHYYHEQYQAFLLNDQQKLALPRISRVPGITASPQVDVFEKTYSHIASPHHIKFITKNNHLHGFVWQTNAKTLKMALRWGIVPSQSITGKVIATLGQYRITAHQRIAKGLCSNTQAMKLTLLDVFQERIEALHELESLVNKHPSREDYSFQFQHYIQQLITIPNE